MKKRIVEIAVKGHSISLYEKLFFYLLVELVSIPYMLTPFQVHPPYMHYLYA